VTTPDDDANASPVSSSNSGATPSWPRSHALAATASPATATASWPPPSPCTTTTSRPLHRRALSKSDTCLSRHANLAGVGSIAGRWRVPPGRAPLTLSVRCSSPATWPDGTSATRPSPQEARIVGRRLLRQNAIRASSGTSIWTSSSIRASTRSRRDRPSGRCASWCPSDVDRVRARRPSENCRNVLEQLDATSNVRLLIMSTATSGKPS
jgi:hypothetical protein